MISQQEAGSERPQGGESSIDYTKLLDEARAETGGEADPVLERATEQVHRAAETVDFVAIELGPSIELARGLADLGRGTAARLIAESRTVSGEKRSDMLESAEHIRKEAARYEQAAISGVIPPELQTAMEEKCASVNENLDDIEAGMTTWIARDPGEHDRAVIHYEQLVQERAAQRGEAPQSEAMLQRDIRSAEEVLDIMIANHETDAALKQLTELNKLRAAEISLRLAHPERQLIPGDDLAVARRERDYRDIVRLRQGSNPTMHDLHTEEYSSHRRQEVERQIEASQPPKPAEKKDRERTGRLLLEASNKFGFNLPTGLLDLEPQDPRWIALGRQVNKVLTIYGKDKALPHEKYARHAESLRRVFKSLAPDAAARLDIGDFFDKEIARAQHR